LASAFGAFWLCTGIGDVGEMAEVTEVAEMAVVLEWLNGRMLQ
jgi:hypothetical protein